MKAIAGFKWQSFEERLIEYRREAFCRTFGHAAPVTKGLRNPIRVCRRCLWAVAS